MCHVSSCFLLCFPCVLQDSAQQDVATWRSQAEEARRDAGRASLLANTLRAQLGDAQVRCEAVYLLVGFDARLRPWSRLVCAVHGDGTALACLADLLV